MIKLDWFETLEKEEFAFYFISDDALPRKVTINGIATLIFVNELMKHPTLTELTDDELNHKWGFVMNTHQLSVIRETIERKHEKKGFASTDIAAGLLEKLIHLEVLTTCVQAGSYVGCKNNKIVFVHKGLTLYKTGEIEYKECFCDVCTARGLENTSGTNEDAIFALLEGGTG